MERKGVIQDIQLLVNKGDKPLDENLKIDIAKHEAKFALRVVSFKDEDYYIAYAPSLNLTGYGDSEREAMSMLSEVVLKDYFEQLFKLPASKLIAELKQYGWTRKPFLAKQLRNTIFIDREGILRNFNLPEETVINEQVLAA